MKLHHVGYCALALSALAVSCKDDVRDEEVPTVSITSPEANTKTWLDVPVAVEVNDNQGVSKVAFYLDDELLGEDTEAPFELSFNSKEYEDGTYTLRTVAYDGTDNISESSQDIEIFNKLLQVNVQGNYITENRQAAWVVVANEEGEVVESIKLANDESFTVNRPEGMTDDQIQVVFLSNWMYNEDGYVSVEQYQNVHPNEMTIEGYSATAQSDPIGSATLKYTVPADHSYSLNTSNITYQFGNSLSNSDGSVEHEVTLDIKDQPALAFLQVEDIEVSQEVAPLYHWLGDIEIGGDYTVKQEDLIPMATIQEVITPADESFYMNVSGKTSNDDYFLLSSSAKPEGASNFKVYGPEDVFEDYRYQLSIGKDNIRYYTTGFGIPSSSYQVPQVDFQFTTNRHDLASATTSFDADYTRSFWMYNESNIDKWRIIYWSVYGDANNGNIEHKRIVLPAEVIEDFSILQAHIDDVTFHETSLSKEEAISSTDDVFKYRFVSGMNQTDGESESFTIYPEYQNTRTAQQLTGRHGTIIKVPSHKYFEKELRYHHGLK